MGHAQWRDHLRRLLELRALLINYLARAQFAYRHYKAVRDLLEEARQDGNTHDIEFYEMAMRNARRHLARTLGGNV